MATFKLSSVSASNLATARGMQGVPMVDPNAAAKAAASRKRKQDIQKTTRKMVEKKEQEERLRARAARHLAKVEKARAKAEKAEAQRVATETATQSVETATKLLRLKQRLEANNLKRYKDRNPQPNMPWRDALGVLEEETINTWDYAWGIYEDEWYSDNPSDLIRACQAEMSDYSGYTQGYDDWETFCYCGNHILKIVELNRVLHDAKRFVAKEMSVHVRDFSWYGFDFYRHGIEDFQSIVEVLRGIAVTVKSGSSYRYEPGEYIILSWVWMHLNKREQRALLNHLAHRTNTHYEPPFQYKGSMRSWWDACTVWETAPALPRSIARRVVKCSRATLEALNSIWVQGCKKDSCFSYEKLMAEYNAMISIDTQACLRAWVSMEVKAAGFARYYQAKINKIVSDLVVLEVKLQRLVPASFREEVRMWLESMYTMPDNPQFCDLPHILEFAKSVHHKLKEYMSDYVDSCYCVLQGFSLEWEYGNFTKGGYVYRQLRSAKDKAVAIVKELSLQLFKELSCDHLKDIVAVPLTEWEPPKTSERDAIIERLQRWARNQQSNGYYTSVTVEGYGYVVGHRIQEIGQLWLSEIAKLKVTGDQNMSETTVSTITEVVPYKGKVVISCSHTAERDQYKWSSPEMGVWAGTRGIVDGYGNYAHVALVNTSKGVRGDYRTGDADSAQKWSHDFGVDPNFDSVGAISTKAKLVTEKTLLPEAVVKYLKSVQRSGKGILPVRGEMAKVTINRTGIWEARIGDTVVRGDNGMPELCAFALGKLSTELEAGLPKPQLFLVRLIAIALGAIKRGSDPRSAGYRWLGHYALGTGTDKVLPDEWIIPWLPRMVSRANASGVFHWLSDDWDGAGSGFNNRPAGFYTIGGFSGTYNSATGEVYLEDTYDWHRMIRRSPKLYGEEAETWCWSELNLPTVDMEQFVKYLPKNLQGLAVRALQRLGLTNLNLDQLAQKLLGPQYYGDSDFFGVRGVSNKLWYDLQFVGAKPFKSVWKGIYLEGSAPIEEPVDQEEDDWQRFF